MHIHAATKNKQTNACVGGEGACGRYEGENKASEGERGRDRERERGNVCERDARYSCTGENLPNP